MKYSTLSSVAALVFVTASASSVFAQHAAPAAPQPWTYKTRHLGRAEVDALLAKPEKLTIIDVRRPDEVTVKGSFPVYLSVQAQDVEKNLAYIPKDRVVLTVSNHAHRAGAVGDLLSSKGFKVAGAAGSEDYEAEGGKIVRITPPAPKTPAVAATGS
jgi:rhodanese-related sulfurtransferase